MSSTILQREFKALHFRQKMIGKRLRGFYAEIEQQPVPQTFLDLLGEADRKTQLH